MSLRLLLILGLAGLLFGCSTEQVKEDEPVAVEDLSSSTSASADGSEESGAQIRRIARKNRNPGNAMEEELEALYRELEAQPIKDGAPRAVHASFDDRFIYMRAIVMQEKPCATCHGQNVEPALKAVIQGAYPDDRAIGFTPGQLRGAFVVEHVISK